MSDCQWMKDDDISRQILCQQLANVVLIARYTTRKPLFYSDIISLHTHTYTGKPIQSDDNKL